MHGLEQPGGAAKDIELGALHVDFDEDRIQGFINSDKSSSRRTSTTSSSTSTVSGKASTGAEWPGGARTSRDRATCILLLPALDAERIWKYLRVPQFSSDLGQHLARARQRLEAEQSRARPPSAGKDSELAAVRSDVDHRPIGVCERLALMFNCGSYTLAQESSAVDGHSEEARQLAGLPQPFA